MNVDPSFVDLSLNAYKLKDASSNNFWPIFNSTFAYGTLRPSQWVQYNTTWYTVAGSNFGSLDVSSISQGNSNLVSLDTTFTDTNGVTRKTIKVTQNGVYRLRVTLTFTGRFDGIEEDFKFTLSNSVYNGSTATVASNDLYMDNESGHHPKKLSVLKNDTKNSIMSFGYVYSTLSEQVDFSSNSTVNFQIDSVGEGGTIGNTPLTSKGFSVIENILYLKNNKPLFFNISGESTNSISYANASGNFTLELLYVY